jgi:transcriptional regulator with XRE-family HTH domain
MNERLRAALAGQGLSYEDISRHVGVDPKTVARWVTDDGRIPHRRHRFAISTLVRKNEDFLWPKLGEQARAAATSPEVEVMKLYPTRGAVPYPLWLSLFSDAKERIDVLAYAGLFLLDNHPELAHLIASRAQSGVAVRLLLGDPDSDAVHRRGEEEGIGEGMAERCRLALRYLDPALSDPRVELRLHETTLYNSIYRGDDVALVNQHMYGAGAPANPVLHLQRVPGGQIFSAYEASFDRVWEGAKPMVSSGGRASVEGR